MSFLDSREQLSPQGIGKSVPRREDARLLMGRGRYANDFSLPGQAYAYNGANDQRYVFDQITPEQFDRTIAVNFPTWCRVCWSQWRCLSWSTSTARICPC
jgi:hypothetical protein